MNRALREQVLAMAKQSGAEIYEGFASGPNMIHFTAEQFKQFTAKLWQEAYDQGHGDGHDEGYDAGQTAAESSAAFAARNDE